MDRNFPTPSRRAALAFSLFASAAVSAKAAIQAPRADGYRPGAGQPLRDWEFLVGRWNVRHLRLKERLAGSDEWQAFAGTCVNWTTLGGEGNVDDNVLELPAGTYRGLGVRAYDAKAGLWSIWWFDSRMTNIDPPVRGRFKDGVGTFTGDDVHNGRPVKVRFEWSKITDRSAHWEQAFSPDGGATWEVNWRMDFTRA